MQGFWKGLSEAAEHQAEGGANVKFFATDLCLNSGGTHVERIETELSPFSVRFRSYWAEQISWAH